jgi:hypothetical protein
MKKDEEFQYPSADEKPSTLAIDWSDLFPVDAHLDLDRGIVSFDESLRSIEFPAETLTQIREHARAIDQAIQKTFAEGRFVKL